MNRNDLYTSVIVLLILLCPFVASARTWTNTDGQRFDGEYVTANTQTVTIRRRADRREFTVALDVLSPEDRKYVKDRIAEANQTYPAVGELEIEIPNTHDPIRWKGCEAFLVEKELEDPEKEVVIATAKPKVKWDSGEHSMVGILEFKGVRLLKNSKPVVRFRFTGSWHGEPYDLMDYSRPISLDQLKGGKIDMGKVKIDLPKP